MLSIVKIAVSNSNCNYPYALQYASDELKNNFDIVKTIISKNGYNLKYASDELKNNIDIVKIAD